MKNTRMCPKCSSPNIVRIDGNLGQYASGNNIMKKIKYGNTNTFLICGTGGNLLVDTDYAGTLPAFYRAIKEHGITISDIDYIMATHYHPDQIGVISELMEQGVKLLLLDNQKPYIHFADEIFSRDKRLHYRPINTDNVNIISSEESRKFLESVGIEGEILSTPSHSEDSISLIMDNGVCIVGDLEPIEYLGAYDKNERIRQDWEAIMRYDPKIIYYAHTNEKILQKTNLVNLNLIE